MELSGQPPTSDMDDTTHILTPARSRNGGAGRLFAPVTGSAALRVAYADPPYIGQAKKHYSHDPRCAEVDHAKLIEHLNTFDAWALSCSSPSLKQILAMCPDDVRVMAWVKPFCAFKVNVNPAYAWEPVIVRGGRKRTRQQETLRDWFSHVITLKKGLVGVKPEKVCHWLFGVLNLQPHDEFHDLFPGSGAVSAAWETWKQQNAGTHRLARSSADKPKEQNELND